MNNSLKTENQIDRANLAHSTIKTITLALGCFWGADAKFGYANGVISTLVGYSGGTTVNPTYRTIGDHSESLQITFDESKITYSNLLDIFFSFHKPIYDAPSSQYMSIIFYDSEEMRIAAENKKTYYEELYDSTIYTQIKPSSAFYVAETYHQKFYLQQDFLIFSDLRCHFTSLKQLMLSKEAAKINGYMAGYGNFNELKKEIHLFNLCEEVNIRLEEIVKGYNK